MSFSYDLCPECASGDPLRACSGDVLCEEANATMRAAKPLQEELRTVRAELAELKCASADVVPVLKALRSTTADAVAFHKRSEELARELGVERSQHRAKPIVQQLFMGVDLAAAEDETVMFMPADVLYVLRPDLYRSEMAGRRLQVVRSASGDVSVSIVVPDEG